jgi:iron complex outermembrane receptor protein
MERERDMKSAAGFRVYLGAGVSMMAMAAPAMAQQQRDAQLAAERPASQHLSDESESANDIVVTAQKIEQRLQDVPIAISAFSPEALDAYKIEGGPELLRAVPNVTFSKGNFSGYDFTIRGIGTKAISASSDPAVAVSFNNTPLIRNRLFESEFFDVQRIEVLRGPQGTLYGRNATGGVVNMIPALPSHILEGDIKGEVGNYATRRLSGMLNVPITDTLAVRVAGALTKRDGFDYNSFTKRRVNDRDLWSTRASIQWEPSDRFKINAIWQHFNEDDNRSRTGKQLCTRDPGPETIGGVTLSERLRSKLSQGCQSASLYDDAAFGAPNGLSLPFISFMRTFSLGNTADFVDVPLLRDVDPFTDVAQSRNLREISTNYDPVFRAKNDIAQLNVEVGVGENFRLISQSAYSQDRYYSSQDYNRFVSPPLFNDSRGLYDFLGIPHATDGITPGGFYNDPQLGPSDRMASADLSRSRSRQWTQELRLQSSFDGPINFNVGANYLDFKSQDDYFVYNNFFSIIAEYFYNLDFTTLEPATLNCGLGDPTQYTRECVYVDYNPIGEGPEDGHNYFRSKNLVRTQSWAMFGETYWQATDDVKITLGARYTKDRKTATPVPSQLLLGGGIEGQTGVSGPGSGGRVSQGYPALPDIRQRWGALTGRLVADWQPDLAFTDDTLVYASASRGYKGGGANPPRVDIDPAVVQYQPLAETFRPEYVNAFEIGTKNSFDGGRLTLNATAFLNLYQDYQVSQIVDRISLNENFDAKTWGLELEAAWRPSRNFRIDTNFGYLGTRIGKGAKSIDVMNRTQGNADWVVVRPNIQVPSNCIAPRAHVETIMKYSRATEATKTAMLEALCSGSIRNGSFDPSVPVQVPSRRFYDQTRYPGLGILYNPLRDAPNGGRGFYADLEGNELPNAPHFTFNIGAQYTFFHKAWELTFRGDFYQQAASYARVFNTEYDRLKAWHNVNLAVTLARPKSDLAVQFYVKNLFNDAPITNFFTNSDDTGLSTNIFTLDPRIFGFSISKKF